MAYWKNQGWFQSSPINKILENENTTLEELFEQDDILQESKSNKKLIDFLKSPKSIEGIINYLTVVSDTEDENRKYKYPWIAAELLRELLSSSSPIFDTFVEDKTSFDCLFDYLFSKAVKDPSNFLTIYVCKVLGFVIVTVPSKIIDGFKSKEEEMGEFFDNLDNNSILELLLKVFASDVSDHAYGFSEWLLKIKMFETIIEKFDISNSVNTHENVSQLISSIVTFSQQVSYSPLLNYLKEDKTVTRILEILKNNENKEEKEENQSINLERKLSALKYGLSAVNDIIRLYIRGIQYDPDDSTPFELLPLPLQSVLQPTDFYISILKTSNQKLERLETTFGQSLVPLGSHRLQVVELFQSIFASRYNCIYPFCLSHNILQEIFDLFFEYQWNNILQIAVFHIIQFIFECNNEMLIHNIINTTKFHDRMAKVGIDSADKKTRPGIMGIITKITDEITTTGYPSIKSLLEESVEWEGYIHGDYQETKRKENTPIGAKTQTSDDDPDEQNSEEIKTFQARTKRNFEITFPDDFAVGDFDDNDLEIYFLPRDEKQFVGITTEEEGMDIFEQLV